MFIMRFEFSGLEHQPNSLDSIDGEPPLPYDPIPIRFDGTGTELRKWLKDF